ncbi:molybdenum cofactor biosynthesis protein MoaA [Sporocytophaga myxococcoides]|uniref:Molybdenum cofactor biosynthesis protein MoaA n=1 Tax=Sporocytophaga myxococcoides TaxID=153721 RepID=A0A098L8C2_9BACT|nr:GTP 3',8-cyclase MoaA [Sporocytophaga myxococcoides]GAL82916.1 molybdenum cofactor biosynthesis protein MoaA [Sporocytophaga myxococcoides]
MLNDKYGRTFKTLRVSLTNACNLFCNYCTNQPVTEKTVYPESNILTTKEYIKIIKSLHHKLNLETVRLTGGEPLLYKDIVNLIEGIREIGIKKVKLTTNAVFLKEKAVSLKNAGITNINVSLDSIDPESFFIISKRRNLKKILEGIDHALAIGLPVKLNTVVMKGMNADQILPLLDFARERRISIRFLEVMKMGHLHNSYKEIYFSQKEILEKIAERHQFIPMDREHSATATYWITDKKQVFGIIANESHPFCRDCNRLRLDSYGNIYGCLSNDDGISIKDHSDDSLKLEYSLKQALSQKQEVQFAGSVMSMRYIGG